MIYNVTDSESQHCNGSTLESIGGGLPGSLTVGQLAIGDTTPTTIIGTSSFTFNAGILFVFGGGYFLAQVESGQFVRTGGTSDDILMGDGSTASLSAIQGETAIGRYDEGNGDTFYPVGMDRTYTGIGGAGALDLGFYDNTGSESPTQGSLGTQSFSMGYNNKNEGYGAFLLGQDSEIPTSGTYAINIGTDNSIGGYSGVGFGTFLTNTTNYGIQIGHSIDFTSGGLNVGIGWGLSETTALSDKVAIFGQGNKEPINSEGFSSNNIGMIIGSGDLTGTGSTKFVRDVPRNSIVVFRDALAGLVNLEASTLTNLKIWDDTYPHAAATVEYVQDAVAGAGTGTIGGTISDEQIAFGNGTDNIQGSAKITYNVAADSLRLQADKIMLADALNGIGLGAGAIWKNGYPYSFSSAENEAYPNTFLGLYAGGNTSLHGTSANGNNDGGNTGIGTYALSSLGAESTQTSAFGSGALAYLTDGDWNTAVGSGAGFFMTTGDRNTAVGRGSMENNTIGSDNVTLGRNAGYLFTNNNQSIYIGNLSKASATTGITNEIAIGHNSTGLGSNTVNLGNTSITNISAGADFDIAGNNSLMTYGASNHFFDAIQDYTRDKFDGSWTFGTGWTNSNDSFVGSAASGDLDLDLSPSFLIGDKVKVIINVSSYTSGTLTISVEGTASTTTITAAGKYEIIIDPVTSSHNDLKIATTTNFTGTINQFKAIGYQANESFTPSGGGGISNIVEDTTPQLGGNLDVNTFNITNANNGSFSIGNTTAGTGVVGTSYLNFLGNEPKIGSYDTAITYGEVSVKYDDVAGLKLKFNDLGNTATGTLNYFGLSDGFVFEDVDIVSFDDAQIQDARLDVLTESTTQNISTTDVGQLLFSTAAGAVTYTIPDTLTEVDGATFTIVAERPGTGRVNISVTA